MEDRFFLIPEQPSPSIIPAT